jgi:hypothetical protein
MIKQTLLRKGRRRNGVTLLCIMVIVVLWKDASKYMKTTSLSAVNAYILSDVSLLRHLSTPCASARIPLSRGILQSSTNSIISSSLSRNSPDRILAADTSVDSRLLARQFIQDGMLAFRLGNVSKSIELFNLAEQMDPTILPFLWQRGLSYYYANEFEKASQQFRYDVRVNPYDVEEIVWDIASQLQSNRNQQPEVAPAFPIVRQLSLPAGSTDRRRIMVCFWSFVHSFPYLSATLSSFVLVYLIITTTFIYLLSKGVRL